MVYTQSPCVYICFRDYVQSLQLEELHFDDQSKADELPEMLLERSAAFNSQPDAFPELLEKLQSNFVRHHFDITFLDFRNSYVSTPSP